MPVGTDDARVVVGIDTVLRNLDKSLRGVDEFRSKLESLSKVKAPTFGNFNASNINKASEAAALAASRAQELANRQERARQAADRLAVSSRNLEVAQRRQAQAAERSAAASGKQADSHVKDFLAAQKAAQRASQEVAKINEQTKRNAEQQTKIQENAAKAIARVQTQEAQRGADAFASSLGEATNAQEKARESTESFTSGLKSLGSGLITAGATLSAVLTVPLIALGVAGVRASAQLDSIKRGLRAVAGSAAEADAQLARLTEVAKLPGIGFQEAIEGSIRLQVVGFSAREAERALRAFSQAVALTGGGRVELERITVQLGQLAAKGKVLSQDLRPIIEAAPAVGKALQEAFGTVNAEDIQKIGLSSREFLDRLISQLETLPAVSGGARNSFDNFTDAVFRAAAVVGDSILPVLTQIIAIAEPAILGLANVFRSLPGPIQASVVAFGVMLAAIGPLLLVSGLLANTIADLTPLMVALNTKAITPLIARVTALGGAFAALRAAATGAAGSLALVSIWGAVAIAAGVLAFVIYNLVKAEKQFATITEDQVKASQDRLNALQQELRFLKDLEGELTRTVEEQGKLLDIYNSLDVQARARIRALGDEKDEVRLLTAELEKLAKAETERLKLQGVTIAAKFAQDLRILNELQTERTNIEKTLERVEKDRADTTRTVNLEEASALSAQQRVVDGLVQRHGQLNSKIDEQEGAVRAGAAALSSYEKITGRSNQSTIELGRTLGQISDKTEDVTEGIRLFTEEQKKSVEVIEATNEALKEQAAIFSDLSAAADSAQKARRAVIAGALDFLRENTRSAEDAIRGLENLRKLSPELDKALLDEDKAKDIEKRLQDILFPKASGAGELKKALEELNEAKLDSQEAAIEKAERLQKQENERRLEENENSFKLEEIAYREYLNRRAILTNANIQLEIASQKRLLDRTRKERDDFLKQLKGKLPKEERTEVETEVEQANVKISDIEGDINRLLSEQKNIRRGISQALKEQAKDEDVELRKLQIEYAELTGRIQDALNAATDDQFAETLRKLGKEQDDLRKRLELSRVARDADAAAEEEAAINRKQNIIDAIEGIRDQNDALNALRVAQDFVNRSQEKHSGLEEDIAFQVEFRGLKEDEALKQRLANEEKLKQQLLISRDIVQDTINNLLQRGIQPPQALVDFIDGINRSVRGLGELSFDEKFDRAQRKFEDLDNARIRKIREVENAVRLRTLAEVEGLIAIRRINGEYVVDLEKQAEALRQIAIASGNRELIQQAKRAGDVAREAAETTGSIGKQIEAAGKDAFRSGLADFFTDITNRTKTAKEATLDLLNSIVRRVNEVIAENLAQSLFESIFGGAEEKGGGLIDKIRSLFGFGKPEGAVVAGAAGAVQETAAVTALTTGATAAATALTTGATVAGTTLGAGAATAAASFATGAAALTAGLAASAAGFSTAVVAAGVAFAAAVAAASAASVASSGLAAVGTIGFASGGQVPLRVSAGEGYIPPSNVRTMGVDLLNRINERKISLQKVASLIRGPGTGTSDSIPASAPAGSYILRADAMKYYSGVFLNKLTKRRHMAEGGLVRNLPEGSFRSSRMMDLKQTIIDARSRLADELVSSEGRQMLVDAITEERTEIRRRLNIDID